MIDMLLSDNHDLQITENADIVVTGSVSQAIKIRLLWFLDEWKFGPKLGVPYYQRILIKGGRKDIVEQIFRRQILSVEEVTDVPALRIDYDVQKRVMKVYYMAVADREFLSEELIYNVAT